LLRSRVEHGTNDHEPRRDGSFAHAEDEPYSEETAKGMASSVCCEGDAPYEDVDTNLRESENVELRVRTTKSHYCSYTSPHPFSDREALKSDILRVLKDEVANVENRAEPIVSIVGIVSL
jgi:hypothetical protein